MGFEFAKFSVEAFGNKQLVEMFVFLNHLETSRPTSLRFVFTGHARGCGQIQSGILCTQAFVSSFHVSSNLGCIRQRVTINAFLRSPRNGEDREA